MSDPEVTDSELLQRFAGGDQPAFEALVARHQDLVRRACWRRLGPSDADDAAQAVFIVLSRKPLQAARHGCLPAWLQRTAHHVASNALRRRRTQRSVAMPAAAEVPMTSDREPDLDRHQLQAQLDAAIERLPQAQREVVVLHYLSGLDHAAVAAALGCPINTVYSRLHRGLERLRQRLAQPGQVGLSGSAVGLLLTDAGRLPLPPAALPVPATATTAAHALAAATTTGLTMTKIALTAAVVLSSLTCAVVGMHLRAQEVPAPAPVPVQSAVPARGVPAMSEQIQVFGVEPVLDDHGYNRNAAGLQVASIEAGSTAERIGLLPDDVLVRLNGQPAANANLLHRAITATPVGAQLTLDIVRDGKPMTLTGVMIGRLRNEDEVPIPWQRFIDSDPLRFAFYAGADPNTYEAGFDAADQASTGRVFRTVHPGQTQMRSVLRYRSVGEAQNGFGTWMSAGPRSLRLSQLHGKRVRFSAEMRTADVVKGCGLWIRSDAYVGDTDCNESTSFDNMHGRMISGTTDWAPAAVVIDVPTHATALAFGVLLKGRGTVWIRNAVLEEVGLDVPSTSLAEACAQANALNKKSWETAQAEMRSQPSGTQPAGRF